MMKKEKIVILSGPSGCGKTTISRFLLSKISNLKLSISCTTRKIRINEKHGKDYFFISKNIFLSKIKKYHFIEWEEVYKNIFYGTLKSELIKIWKNNNNILFDVDVKGGINLKKLFYKNSISIFIFVKSENILKKRLIKRNSENIEKINIRLKKLKEENNHAYLFDFIINNKNLKKTKKKILKLVRNFIEINK
ncbi:guanylate kinase [Blattabacterium cuenoti]|uniref:guanylate kinase n=1 Tax=Blattabacterium cuenoti TaxID=1653831 RepID=UPI00293B9E6D|nr:guanylate kinase [Blattabacterium cuenoti]